MGILSYGYKAFKGIKKAAGKGKVSPTITQPRQLKKTMEKIRSENKRFAFEDAKTAKDRANIVRKKKSIERMDKLEALQEKRKAGIKASKDVKKMVDTGQANKVGGSVFSKTVRERKMGGGMMGRPMYKKGSKKAVGKKSDFGMLSVKAGIDNNPNPTQADRIAGAKMKKKK
tara:strand:- start:229 stop:744 length:516 start_codon:yes stop_codon:yes gene_type:complete